MNTLEVKNLNLKINSKDILSDIGFSLGKWQSLAFLWHNGSGKTSLLKSIMGLYKSDWDIIFKWEQINNLEVYERSRKGIWYILQEIPEYNGISVLTYLKGVLQNKYDEKVLKAQFNTLWLDFDVYKNRYFDSKLSGWEKKKIEIILTFMLDKDLYLLDEVETGLDVTSRNILKDMISEQMKLGKSFIIVSHYEDLINIANNALLLCNWKIQNFWKVDEIYKKYSWKCENCKIPNNCK